MNSKSKMRSTTRLRLLVRLCATLFLLAAQAGFAQVSPAEILNPRLKAAEKAYFPQLLALNRDIRAAKFPFPFVLSRYVGLDPSQQPGTDTRGVEFVKFHDRIVLKATGNYNAAYNAALLTRNQRAGQTFQEVIVPVLRLVAKDIPADVACDAIGFEVSYHVRGRTKNSDFEGKEILVIVFEREDAFGFLQAQSDAERQDILNRSEIYVDGENFGLALGERDPLDVSALDRPSSHPPVPAAGSTASANGAAAEDRLARINRDLLPGLYARGPQAPVEPRLAPSGSAPAARSGELPAPVAPATQADAERLQARYQAQLDALAKDGVAKFHFVKYAPPSFVIFQNRVVLQLTLRNPLAFDRNATSIYKRAAQSFDLFLAPQIKAILDKLPQGEGFDVLDITILDQFTSGPSSSEALEFACSLKPLRQFADAEITNQDLVNQSVVLVNGVRIALNLQQVE